MTTDRDCRLYRCLLAAILLGFAFYYAIYTAEVCVNVVFLPWFPHLDVIAKYFDGTLRIGDLVQRTAEHGLFGYNFLLLLNLRFFRLNALFDAYLNVLLVFGVAAIVATAYSATLSRGHARILGASLLFLPVAFALFTVTQGATAGGMETQVRLGTFFILLAAFLIDRACHPPDRGAPSLQVTLTCALSVIVATLVFGTLYTFAWFPGIVLACGAAGFRERSLRRFALIIILVLVATIPAYIFFYQLSLPPSSGSPQSLGARLLFTGALTLGALGNATLTRSFWEEGLLRQPEILLVNGAFVAAAYVYAGWLWRRTRMLERTWLPMAMIASSIGVAILVGLGRSSSEWMWGTSYWYAVHTKFGLAGCLWVYGYAVQRRADRPQTAAVNFTCYGFLAVLVTSLFASNLVDWRRAPQVRHLLEDIAGYGLSSRPLPVDEQGLTPFFGTPYETNQALRLLRQHHLSFYANLPSAATAWDRTVLVAGEAKAGVRLGLGWHAVEGDHRWIAGQAELFFRTGPSGQIVVEGYMPGFVSPNRITLSVAGRVLTSEALGEGFFAVHASAPPDQAVELLITLEKHVTPRAAGLNLDERDLGAMIKHIETR